MNYFDDQDVKTDPPSTKRDDYFRCKVCKELFSDKVCELDPVKGYQCPNGCIETFNQPPYQSPLISDEDTKNK